MADIREITDGIFLLTSNKVNQLNEQLLTLGRSHKHGKTEAQRKKDIAKRRKKNKNKKTHRK